MTTDFLSTSISVAKTENSNIEGGEGLVSSTNLIAGRTPEVTIVVLPYGFVLAAQIKDRL